MAFDGKGNYIPNNEDADALYRGLADLGGAAGRSVALIGNTIGMTAGKAWDAARRVGASALNAKLEDPNRFYNMANRAFERNLGEIGAAIPSAQKEFRTTFGLKQADADTPASTTPPVTTPTTAPKSASPAPQSAVKSAPKASGVTSGKRRIRGTNEYTDANDGRLGDALPTDNLSIVPSFDYVGQLARLRAIDPERYGGLQKTSGLPEGYQDLDTSTMSFGELAAAAAKNSALLRNQEKQTALQIAQMQNQAQNHDNKARDALYNAQAKLIGSQADEAELRRGLLEKLGDSEFQNKNPEGYNRVLAMYKLLFGGKETPSPAEEERAKAIAAAGYDPVTLEKLPGYADGGLVRPYGGAPQMNSPLLAEYGQYLQVAAQAKIPPVPFSHYVNLLAQTRAKMNQTPSQFADGGKVGDDTPAWAIDVSGKKVIGPGTGKSDSIPAVIDGSKPAALSTGEYVIPAHVVRAKGTEFFDKLIAQYADNGGYGNGEK